MSAKVTQAGRKVLAAFDQRPDDTWEISSLMMNEVSRRSGIWTPQVYRVVDKLLRDGLLSSRPSHNGARYERTEAGTSAAINASAEILRGIGRLWRDPEARKRFEGEGGLSPIVTGNSLEVEAQHQSGRTKEYHDKFHEWAALLLAKYGGE